MGRLQLAQSMRARVGVALAAAGLVLTGCTDTTQLPADQQTTPAAVPESEPSWYVYPGDAAGELSLETFPSLSELGEGWSYATTSATQRDASPGGDSPAIDRGIGDVIQESIPDECVLNEMVPMPAAALEVRYAFRDKPVTAYEVAFASPSLAQIFFSLRRDELESCQGRQAPIGGGMLVGQAITLDDGVVLSSRNPDLGRDAWMELLVLKDSSVVWLQATGELGDEPFTSGRVLSLAKTFGSSSG